MRRSALACLRTRCLFVLTARLENTGWKVRYWPKADIELIPDSRTHPLRVWISPCARLDGGQYGLLPFVGQSFPTAPSASQESKRRSGRIDLSSVRTAPLVLCPRVAVRCGIGGDSWD